MNEPVTSPAPLAITGTQPIAEPPWPRGLRVLFVLCFVSVLTGGAEIASLATIARDWFGRPGLQAAYWVIGWVLAVAALAAGALGRRRAFGVLCLAACSLNVVMSSYFNLTITADMLRSGAAGAWNGNTLIYFWNWIAIGFNAAVCAYLLRYEWPRWRAGDAAGQRGFPVTEAGATESAAVPASGETGVARGPSV